MNIHTLWTHYCSGLLKPHYFPGSQRIDSTCKYINSLALFYKGISLRSIHCFLIHQLQAIRAFCSPGPQPLHSSRLKSLSAKEFRIHPVNSPCAARQSDLCFEGGLLLSFLRVWQPLIWPCDRPPPQRIADGLTCVFRSERSRIGIEV